MTTCRMAYAVFSAEVIRCDDPAITGTDICTEHLKCLQKHSFYSTVYCTHPTCHKNRVLGSKFCIFHARQTFAIKYPQKTDKKKYSIFQQRYQKNCSYLSAHGKWCQNDRLSKQEFCEKHAKNYVTTLQKYLPPCKRFQLCKKRVTLGSIFCENCASEALKHFATFDKIIKDMQKETPDIQEIMYQKMLHPKQPKVEKVEKKAKKTAKKAVKPVQKAAKKTAKKAVKPVKKAAKSVEKYEKGAATKAEKKAVKKPVKKAAKPAKKAAKKNNKKSS